MSSLTIKAALQQAELQLTESGITDSPLLDAEVLLAHVLDKNRSFFFAWPEQLLEAEAQQRFKHLLAGRAAGQPIAYLTGIQEFWSRPFVVNKHTLVPRPETEQMIDAMLARHADECAVVWDAGTGTGAIAVVLATERKHWQVFASDYSAGALRIAAKNITTNNAAVSLVRGSWLQLLAAQSLDILVSNPPYIAADDSHLEALRYEPISALVAADSGMADIKLIVEDAQRVLKPSGWIYLEHGYDQGEAVTALLQASGFADVCCHKDYASQDRFTCGRWP